MDKIGVSLGYLLVQVFNFGILFVVIFAWVIKPVMKMMQERKETLEKGLEDAQVAAKARANAEQDAEEIITQAQQKASRIIQEATERAEGVGQEIQMKAKEEIAKEREAALAEMEVEKRHMLNKIRSKVVKLSIAAAKHLVGENLLGNEESQHQLINEFFSGIRDGRIKILETVPLSGNSAVVTSAVELTDEEKETVRNYMLSNLDENIVVDFQVDVSILGGLIVRVGDHVIDGSVVGKLHELQQELS